MKQIKKYQISRDFSKGVVQFYYISLVYKYTGNFITFIAFSPQFQSIVRVNNSSTVEKAEQKLFETTQGDNNPFTLFVNLLVILTYMCFNEIFPNFMTFKKEF